MAKVSPLGKRIGNYSTIQRMRLCLMTFKKFSISYKQNSNKRQINSVHNEFVRVSNS